MASKSSKIDLSEIVSEIVEDVDFSSIISDVNNIDLLRENTIKFIVSNVNFLMNQTAKSYGYDSIDNAISYYNSGITSWRNEAIAFNTWRDNTVSLMYDNIFSFTADGITLPDLPGFTGQTGYFDVGITSPSRPNLFS